MNSETWNAIGKYGFATVAAVLLAVYYRTDVVLPQRAQSEVLIRVNEQQAETQKTQTAILQKMSDGIEQIKQDQQKFPAVAEARP